MHRTHLAAALVIALIGSPDQAVAQVSSNLPVIKPTVVELGGYRDTSLTTALTPQEASLSPRGTFIAYTISNNLRLWNVSTRTSRVVLKGWSTDIAWSPAGDAIAFVHAGENDEAHIWLQRLNPVTGESVGPAQRVSLAPALGFAPSFAPDGKSIAFVREDGGQRTSLIVVPATGGAERALVSGYSFRHLRWASDGGAIYYGSTSDSARPRTNWVLSKIAVSGGTPQRLYDFKSDLARRIVSGDARVVVSSDDANALHIATPAGRDIATVSLPPGITVTDYSGTYRKAGVREIQPRSLRITNVADGKGRELIDSTADVQAISWFEDNRRVAAIAFYDGIGMLVTMNIDGTGVRKLPLTVQPFHNATVGHGFALALRVSPDGQYAVYQGPNRASLELVELSTGKQRTIARGQTINPPVWLRDSRAVRYLLLADVALRDPAYATIREVSVDGADKLVRAFPRAQYARAIWLVGENQVSVFGGPSTSLAWLDGTPDRLVVRATTRVPAVISDDGLLVAVSPGEVGSHDPGGKVILFSPADGLQRTVDLPFADIKCDSFSPDRRHLYCRGREKDTEPQVLYEVPVDGSKPRVVTRIDSREFMGAFELSPDGKWALQTVTGVRRIAFVSIDFTDAMTRLLSTSAR